MAMDKQVNEKIHIKKDEDSDKGKTMPHVKISDKEAAEIISTLNHDEKVSLSGFLKELVHTP